MALAYAVALYDMTGIAVEPFQQFPVVWYNDSLHVITGLLPLTTGLIANRFLQSVSLCSLHFISGTAYLINLARRPKGIVCHKIVRHRSAAL